MAPFATCTAARAGAQRPRSVERRFEKARCDSLGSLGERGWAGDRPKCSPYLLRPNVWLVCLHCARGRVVVLLPPLLLGARSGHCEGTGAGAVDVSRWEHAIHHPKTAAGRLRSTAAALRDTLPLTCRCRWNGGGPPDPSDPSDPTLRTSDPTLPYPTPPSPWG